MVQGGRYYIVPGVKQVHDITVSFQLPSLFQHYDAKVRGFLELPSTCTSKIAMRVPSGEAPRVSTP